MLCGPVRLPVVLKALEGRYGSWGQTQLGGDCGLCAAAPLSSIVAWEDKGEFRLDNVWMAMCNYVVGVL